MICMLAMIAGAVAGNFYQRSPIVRQVVDSLVKNPLPALIHRDPLIEFTPENQFPPDKQHVLTVLLLGCDHDYEQRRPVPIMNRPGRSDAILIARVDLDNKKVSILSIPRDTAVRIPGHGLNKINAAHAIGEAPLTQKTIKHVFGIDADYWVSLNFEGFQKVVDAIGGVDVDVKQKMDYDDNWGNLHIHLKPGLQHLNGYRAMGYVRMRHSDDDLHRAARQQEFLESVRAQVMQPAVFLKLPDALQALTSNIKHNFQDTGQMLALINFARKCDRSNIHVATLPTIAGPSYVYVKHRESVELVRLLFYDNDPMADIQVVDAPDSRQIAVVTGHWEGGRHRKNRQGRRAGSRTQREESDTPLLAEPGSPGEDGITTSPASEESSRRQSEGDDRAPREDRDPARRPEGGENPGNGNGKPADTSKSDRSSG